MENILAFYLDRRKVTFIVYPYLGGTGFQIYMLGPGLKNQRKGKKQHRCV